MATGIIGCAELQQLPTAADDDVADAHMANMARTNTDTETAYIGMDHAIGNGDVFRLDLLILQPLSVAAQGDTVIAGFDHAIRNRHIAAGVDIDTVGIEHIDGIMNLDAPDIDKPAAVEEHRPAAGPSDCNILHIHMAALDKGYQLAGTHTRGRGDSGNTAAPPEPPGMLQHILHEGIAIAIQDAKAGDGNMLQLMGDDQMLAQPVFTGDIKILGIGVRIVIVLQTVRGQENRTVFQVQLNERAQPNRTAFEYAGGNRNSAAACGCTGIDGGLDRRGIQGLSIGNGPVFHNVEHIPFPPYLKFLFGKACNLYQSRMLSVSRFSKYRQQGKQMQPLSHRKFFVFHDADIPVCYAHIRQRFTFSSASHIGSGACPFYWRRSG